MELARPRLLGCDPAFCPALHDCGKLMTPRFLVSLLAFLLLTSASAPPAPPPGRLGDDVRPTLQSLTLRLDPSKADYSGSTRITFENKQRIFRFRLHAQEMNLTQVAVSRSGRTLGAHAVTDSSGFVEIRLDAPLEPGSAQLDIEFS